MFVFSLNLGFRQLTSPVEDSLDKGTYVLRSEGFRKFSK